jgi:glycosyltransferase involved in cell wall biosynthesis
LPVVFLKGAGVNVRVAIDARVKPGPSGGVAQALASLITGLGRLDDGSEAYTIVVKSEEQAEWLKPHLGPRQEFVVKPKPAKPAPGPLDRVRRRIARSLLSHEQAPPSIWGEVPVSDGFYEGLGCDVVHFMKQMHFTLCALPTIYNPHDLQHLHYPKFFAPAKIAKRETIYRAGCHFAKTVVVGSQWTKDDVVNKYQVDPNKVQVIGEHSPGELSAHIAADVLSATKKKYNLEDSFAIYPAVTWPHKNHIRLLEALAGLRDSRGLTINLVCTGARDNAHWPMVESYLTKLNLQKQVRFLGFVAEPELKALYRMADFLVMPTLFEASSLPIFEAWLEGTPVACSTVTALPEQVGDSALTFDAFDTKSIANAVARIATDAVLRDQLTSRGYRRLQDFSWERTAKAYRAVYRRAAGCDLNEEDRWLLSWDWMRYPDRKMEVA